jgi:hypothetical protein
MTRRTTMSSSLPVVEAVDVDALAFKPSDAITPTSTVTDTITAPRMTMLRANRSADVAPGRMTMLRRPA